MSPALIAACLWAIAATVTAFLPMRLQFPPGIVLLLMAPVLLVWIGLSDGLWLAVAGTVGFLSMFRRPLAYYARKLMGKGEGT